MTYFPFAEYWWFYLGFTGFVLLLLVLDLGVFHRRAHVVSFREASLWNPMLLFIAHFVWIGVSQEASATQMKAAMARTLIRAAMLTDFRHLDGGDTLADAVRLILEGSQQDFPVLEGVRVAGMLTRSDLLVALAEHGQDYPVTAAMRRDFRLFRLFGGCRGEIEATAVEIDRVDEVLFVAEPSGRIFHPLDLGFDRLAGGVGDPMTEIGDHVFEGSAS